MKAAFIERAGPPESIVYGDLPTPQPTGAEVLVKVTSVAVNPAFSFGLFDNVQTLSETVSQGRSEIAVIHPALYQVGVRPADKPAEPLQAEGKAPDRRPCERHHHRPRAGLAR